MLDILPFTIGGFATNTYLIADAQTGEAAVIDPAGEGELLAAAASERCWRIGSVWLTHAHFDHIAGAGALVDLLSPPPLVALHPADYPLWRAKGGAAMFNVKLDPGPEPAVELAHGMILRLGAFNLEVRHAPGHTPGHVVFYCAQAKAAFCGDVVFEGSIGRADFPGGDYETLIASIRTQILSLPDETRLFAGHGPETTVGDERRWNPYLA